jgi:DNA-binding HxlR family transcriptional regulator
VPRSEPSADPLRATLDLLGDQWTLLIVQSVFLRVRRYEDVRRRLGISPTALATRLRVAVEAGVLVRAPYRGGGRTRQEYRLTPRGLELWALLVAIWSWERSWVPGRAATLPTLTHLDCGAATAAPLGCRACGGAADDVRLARTGPPPLLAAATQRRFRRRDAEPYAGDPLLFFPATTQLLGDRWNTGLLVSALLGAGQFTGFQRELGIGPSVLAQRLRDLVAAGVFTPAPYALTAKGLAFRPALAHLVEWARPGYAGREPPVTVWHGGHELRPVPRCEHCGELLRRTAVRFSPGVR